jgi:hypothetical protein
MTDAISDLKYWCKGEPSECGKRVALLLAIWAGGSHHLPSDEMKKVDWQNPYFIRVRMDKYTIGAGLATHDFSALTRLVFLAHDHCIRVELSPLNFRHMVALFHPRHKRDGGVAERHPSIEQALYEWRLRYPTAPFVPEGMAAQQEASA